MPILRIEAMKTLIVWLGHGGPAGFYIMRKFNMKNRDNNVCLKKLLASGAVLANCLGCCTVGVVGLGLMAYDASAASLLPQDKAEIELQARRRGGSAPSCKIRAAIELWRPRPKYR